MKNTKHAVLAAAALFCAGGAYCDILSVTPAAWKGYPDCWQMKRHAEKMEQVRNGGAKVVFIGDSITHFWETHGKEQWNRYFSKGRRAALNLGTSADRTEHVLWRIEEGGELDGYEAKCILLMIGTNNTGHREFADEPPVDTILGIKRILDAIAEKQPGARTILTAIFPRGAEANDPKRLRNDAVNKEIAKFADGKKVIWCDFTDKFLDADGRLSRELFPDLLHPCEAGYEIWASAVVPLVDKVLEAPEDEAIPSVWPSRPRLYSKASNLSAEPVSGFPGFMWWGKGRPLDKRNEIAGAGRVEYDLVMAGDSITHRWERKGGEGRELYAGLKQKYKVLNLGYGGDQTRHLIWRLENGELEGYTAKLFQVMIGTNNRDRNPADTAAGIKRIVETIRRKHPESKILLLPIFPRGADAGDERRAHNEKINALARGLADGDTVIWFDFNERFLDAEGRLTKEVMDDLLHPNANGYRIWLDAVMPLLEKYCGKR